MRKIWGKTPGAVEESSVPFSGVFYNAGNWMIGFDSSRILPTDNEIRPINKAVRYFIKAK